MKIIASFIALAVLGLISTSQAAPQTYKIDATHSSLIFKVKHFFSNVTGKLPDVEGTLIIDPDKPEAAQLDAKVAIKSIDTANAKRDTHLKDADFFNATKFPEATFKSKSIKMIDKDSAEVLGDMTIHGVTKEVPLQVKFLGKGKGMTGEITGWEAKTKINRRDFGLIWAKMVEGVAAVGDEVEIEISVEANLQP